MNGPIIIGSDGSPGSEGALRVGLALARERGVPAEVLTVLQPQSPALYGEVLAAPQAYSMLQAAQEEEARVAITEQVEAITPPDRRWSVAVEVGRPARTIASFAGDRDASLIVLGTGPRSTLERWLRSEVSLKVVQLASVPVLLVPPGTRDLPSAALVAVDFSGFSVQAAKAVLPLLKEGGRIVLVHVVWKPAEVKTLPSLNEYWTTYEQGAEARLAELAADLRGSTSARIEAHVMAGDPVQELLACAGRFNVDLIAAGSHGQGFLDRIVMGSVSTRLAHGARCSLLISPPATTPKESEGSSPGS